MFYEIDQINEICFCKKCKNLFDVPKVLPCGNAICERCISHIQESFRSWDVTKKKLLFDCPICGEGHNLPEYGEFKTDLTIVEILNKRPRDVWRGDRIDLLKRLLNENKELEKNIKTTLDQDDNKLVINRFKDIRNDLEISFKIQLECLNGAYSKILHQINSREKDFLNKIDIAKGKILPKMVQDMKYNDNKNNINLNRHDFQSIEVENSIDKTKKIQNCVNKEISSLVQLSKEFQSYEFKPQNKKIDTFDIGVFQKKTDNKETMTNR